jgi:hypothetical protein
MEKENLQKEIERQKIEKEKFQRENEKFQRENEEMKKQLSKLTIAPTSTLKVKLNNFKYSKVYRFQIVAQVKK